MIVLLYHPIYMSLECCCCCVYHVKSIWFCNQILVMSEVKFALDRFVKMNICIISKIDIIMNKLHKCCILYFKLTQLSSGFVNQISKTHENRWPKLIQFALAKTKYISILFKFNHTVLNFFHSSLPK